MKNSKVILLAEIPVLPEFLEEVKELSTATIAPSLLEPGCEAFYQTSKEDQPNTLIIFEIFSSQEMFDVHLAADYTKDFMAGIQGKLAGPPLITHLNEF